MGFTVFQMWSVSTQSEWMKDTKQLSGTPFITWDVKRIGVVNSTLEQCTDNIAAHWYPAWTLDPFIIPQ